MISISRHKVVILQLIVLSFLVCFFIANRNPYLADYQMYLTLFELQWKGGLEVSYGFLSYLFSGDAKYFVYFLFLYAVLGFGLKVYFAISRLYVYGGLYCIIAFSITYFCSFFEMWDLIQIRYSAAISFFLLGVFNKKKFSRIILFLLSVMFHYSLVFFVSNFLLFSYVKSRKMRLMLVPLVSLFDSLIVIYSSYGKKYSEVAISGASLHSGIYISIYLMFFVSFIFRKRFSSKYSGEVYSLFLTSSVTLVLMIALNHFVIGLTDRLMTLCSLLFIICLLFVENKSFKILLTLVLIVYNVWVLNVYIFNPNGLLSTNHYTW